MRTYIALFRGINVAGNNPLPMRDLVRILERMGSKDIKTCACCMRFINSVGPISAA